ncbi:MAG: FKBP-type peptidyl-prolyl cis-trans isomerase [Bacteroidales bacterium]|nr:FKBP-type peptidyl-prolyl cis-trans isomerase [Bacteroidales bacterium]
MWIRKIFSTACVIFIVVGMIACSNNENVTQNKDVNRRNLEEDLLYANKRAVASELNRIADYVKRYSYDMTVSGTGLHYQVTKDIDGELGMPGQIIEMEYILQFLWGDTAYMSKTSGPLIFEIGHGNVESGLEELALLVSSGDHVKAIIPSYLGYGLLGDGNKIPAKASLVYDIQIVSIENK